MRSSSVSYLIGGVNFGSAALNFVLMIQNVNKGDDFALANMFFVLLGVFLGTTLMSLGAQQESQGR